MLVAVLAGVLLLPLVHNLVYGRAFVLMVSSVTSSNNLPIRPARLLDLPSDPEVRSVVADRFSQMLNLSEGWWGLDLLLIGLRVSQALWVIAIVIAFRRRTWYHVAVALLPVSYLAIHVVFSIHLYYPRHIIAGHLAMAVSACLAALPPAPGPSRNA